MKKFVLIVAVAGLVLLGIHLWSNDPAPSSPDAPAPSTAVPAPRVRTAASAPNPTVTYDAKGWETTVKGFATAYPATKGMTRQKWLAKLRPYLDKDVIDVLDDTDLAQVPAGHYVGYQLLRIDGDVVTVRVTYREGWSLVLYLAEAAGHWTVASFDTVTASDE